MFSATTDLSIGIAKKPNTGPKPDDLTISERIPSTEEPRTIDHQGSYRKIEEGTCSFSSSDIRSSS